MITSIKGHLLYGEKDLQERRRKDGRMERLVQEVKREDGRAREEQRGEMKKQRQRRSRGS